MLKSAEGLNWINSHECCENSGERTLAVIDKAAAATPLFKEKWNGGERASGSEVAVVCGVVVVLLC